MPLQKSSLRPRDSRHGKPLTEVYKVTWKTVETDKKTGEFKTVTHERTMTELEIQAARDRIKRASDSTNSYGQKNGTVAKKKAVQK